MNANTSSFLPRETRAEGRTPGGVGLKSFDHVPGNRLSGSFLHILATCVQCGMPLQRGSGVGRKRMYCSSRCKFAFYANGLRHFHTKQPLDQTPCKNCGTNIALIGAKQQKFCTKKCRIEKSNRIARERNAERLSKRPPLKCFECLGDFHPTSNNHSVFCSPVCGKRSNRRHNTRLRRKKISRERFSVAEVFEAAGWRCAHCFIETPKSLRGKILLNAPVMDHIIPLSRGGRHSKDNAQLLCFRCNGRKGSKTMEEFRAAS